MKSIKTIAKRHKLFFLMNGIMLLLLFVLLWLKPIDHIRKYDIERQTETNPSSIKIHDSITVKQSFESKTDVNAFEININAANDDYHGVFEVSLYDASQKIIKHWKIDKLEIVKAQEKAAKWLSLYVGDKSIEADQVFFIEISAPSLSEDTAVIVKSIPSEMNANMECWQNDKKIDGILEFAVYKDQGNPFAVLAVIILFLTANYWYLSRNQSLNKTAFWILLGIGLIMFLIMAPGSQPDEHTHYWSSVKLSNIIMGKHEINSIDKELDYRFTSHYNSNRAFSMILNHLGDKFELNGETVHIGRSDGLDSPLAYIAPACGITIARLLGCNFVQTYELARLFNLLLYVLLAYIAVRIMPGNKQLLLFICMIPMAMHEASSLSRDTFVNGMSLVFFSYIIREANKKEIFTWAKTALCLLMLCLFGPIKVVYCILAVVLLFIPRENFKNTTDRILKVGVVILGTAIALYLSQRQSIAYEITKESYSGYSVYPITYALSEPLRFAKHILSYMEAAFLKLTEEAVGSKLAGQNVLISEYWVLGYLIILVVMAIKGDEKVLLPTRNKVLGILLCLLGYALLASVFLFANTPYGHTAITGFQGRYLIPFIPLLLFCINSKKQVIVVNERICSLLIWIIELGYIIEVMGQISTPL